MDHGRHATLASQGSGAHPRARGGTEDPLHVEARRELANLEFGLDEEDARDVLVSLSTDDSAGRLESARTGEWMYLFRPRVGGTILYVKLVLRNDCVVVSFHEAEDEGHEEDA